MLSKRNFWNTCPLKLSYFPESSCDLGKHASAENAFASCEWSINSPEDHYCFWTYVRKRSTSDGLMDPVSQVELAKLMNLPQLKMTQATKEALDALKSLKAIENFEALTAFLDR
jgi:hypothetical protein